jgi:hypothetical protein
VDNEIKQRRKTRMANIKHGGWFVYGAVAGVLLSLVLPLIIGWLVGTTGISGVTFATYNVRESLTAYAAQGNAWAGVLLSYIGGGIQMPAIVLTALGLGTLLFAVRWLFDILGLESMVPAKVRTPVLLLVASILAGWVISGDISKGLPAFAWGPVIFFAVTGLLISFVMDWFYKMAKWSMPQ